LSVNEFSTIFLVKKLFKQLLFEKNEFTFAGVLYTDELRTTDLANLFLNMTIVQLENDTEQRIRKQRGLIPVRSN